MKTSVLVLVGLLMVGCAPTMARYVHPATQEALECRRDDTFQCTLCGVPILEGVGSIIDAVDQYQKRSAYAQCKDAAEAAGYTRVPQ